MALLDVLQCREVPQLALMPGDLFGVLNKVHLLIALTLHRNARPRLEDETRLIAHCLISFDIDINASWRRVRLHACCGVDGVTEQVKLIFFIISINNLCGTRGRT